MSSFFAPYIHQGAIISKKFMNVQLPFKMTPQPRPGGSYLFGGKMNPQPRPGGSKMGVKGDNI